MTTTLKSFYDRWPKQSDCLAFLEETIWGGIPQCPYCKAKKNTPMRKENRYHCNYCNTSYSVTVGTLFHKTRADLQIWFFAIYLMKMAGNLTVRELSNQLQVTRDSAWRIGTQIKKAMIENRELIDNLYRKLN